LAALVASPFVLVTGVAMAAAGSGALQPGGGAAVDCAVGPVGVGDDTGGGGRLTADQLGNARIIVQVGRSLRLPARAAVLAVATAMQESRLHNLTVATNFDSLGLFQQRPSQGWGSAAQLTNPVYASAAFYARLVRVPGWQNLPLAQVAQAVQHSAFPDAYARWEPLALRLVATFAGPDGACSTGDGDGQPTSGSVALPADFRLPPGTPTPVVRAVAWSLAQLGTPYSYGGDCTAAHSGSRAHQCDCSSLVMMAYRAGGIRIPRTTVEQVRIGTPIYDPRGFRPGDLLFTPGRDGTRAAPGHVGMYLGRGLLIEAPHTGAVVRISRYAGHWARELTAARRII
jgi:cell wall-associated NlpC family hydrolase